MGTDGCKGIRQKDTPQSATHKKTEETEKRRERKGKKRWEEKKRERDKKTALGPCGQATGLLWGEGLSSQSLVEPRLCRGVKLSIRDLVE